MERRDVQRVSSGCCTGSSTRAGVAGFCILNAIRVYNMINCDNGEMACISRCCGVALVVLRRFVIGIIAHGVFACW